MIKKVILVTGASSGIGEATTAQLLQSGSVVYVTARKLADVADLEAKGALPLKMDITRQDDVQAVVKTIISAHGQIDVLINNAGYAEYGPVENVPIENARKQFEVNIFGLARLTQLIIPHMRQAQSGTIINVSSMGGKMYTPLGAWYHASKHALEGWSDCLRIELKQFGVKVVIIEPGVINTSFYETMLKPLIKRTAGGPYETLAKGLKRTTSDNNGSPPALIASTIVKAVNSSNPQTRYVAGKYARLLLFLRAVLSDKLFDKLILRASK